MANEKLSIEYEVRDNASANLKKITDGLKDAEKGLDDTTEAMKKNGKESKGLGTKLGSLKTNVMTAVSGFKKLSPHLSEAIEQYVEAQQIVSRYEFTLKNLGASSELLSGASARMNENLERTGFSVREQQAALQHLTIKLGDPQKALDNLALALDMSAVSGDDLAESAKKLGEVMTGQVGSLEKIGILTKNDSNQINQLKDSSDRAAAAMELLRAKVSGASDAIDPQLLMVRNHRAAMDELNESVGKWSLAAVDAALSIVTLGNAADKAGSSMGWLADKFSKSADGMSALSAAMGEDGGISKLVTRIQYGNTSVQTLMSSGEELRKTLGLVSEEQARLQEAVNASVKSFGLQSVEAQHAANALNRYLNAQEESVASLKGTWADLSDTMMPFSGGSLFPDYSEFSPTAKKRVEKKEEKKPQAPRTLQENAIDPLSSIIDGAQAEAEAKAAKAAALDWRNYVADAQYDILNIKAESAKIEAQYLLDLDKIEHALEDRQITRSESRLQRTQAYFDYQKSINLEQANLQRQLDDEQKQQNKERDEENKRRLEEHIAIMRNAGLTIADALTAGTSKAMKGLGGLSAGITNISTNYANAGKDAKDSGRAQSEAAAGGAQAIAAFAESQGASQEMLNGIMAVAATAQGFLNIAYGNIPGSIAAFTSAAIYGANAAIGGGGGSSASVSTPSAPAQGPTKQEAYEGMYQAQLRALRDARDEGKETIIYNFSGATFLDGNVAAQRRVENAMSRTSRMTLGTPNA